MHYRFSCWCIFAKAEWSVIIWTKLWDVAGSGHVLSLNLLTLMFISLCAFTAQCLLKSISFWIFWESWGHLATRESLITHTPKRYSPVAREMSLSEIVYFVTVIFIGRSSVKLDVVFFACLFARKLQHLGLSPQVEFRFSNL